MSQKLHFTNVFYRKPTQVARDVHCSTFCNIKKLKTIQTFFNKILG